MEEIYIETTESQYIYATLSKAETYPSEVARKRLAIMVHGFPSVECGRHRLFQDVEAYLNQIGIDSLRFDFSHCGKSDGHTRDFKLSTARHDFRTVMMWAHKKGYDDFGVVAEGLGATIALVNSASPVRFFVLAWPALNLRLLMEEYYKVVEQKVLLEREGHILCENQKIGRKLLDEMIALKIEPHLGMISAPTLVLHGVLDERISIGHLDVARESLAAQRLDITAFQDGRHGLEDDRHRKASQTHIRHFLERYAF